MTTSHTAGVDARVPAKLTIPAIQGMKERGERIAMLTAYDAAGARLARSVRTWAMKPMSSAPSTMPTTICFTAPSYAVPANAVPARTVRTSPSSS